MPSTDGAGSQLQPARATSTRPRGRLALGARRATTGHPWLRAHTRALPGRRGQPAQGVLAATGQPPGRAGRRSQSMRAASPRRCERPAPGPWGWALPASALARVQGERGGVEVVLAGVEWEGGGEPSYQLICPRPAATTSTITGLRPTATKLSVVTAGFWLAGTESNSSVVGLRFPNSELASTTPKRELARRWEGGRSWETRREGAAWGWPSWGRDVCRGRRGAGWVGKKVFSSQSSQLSV